jgi:uncharacterized OsmC-like protein
MGVRMSGRYRGNKRVELRHDPSGAVFSTAAPLDNSGDGSSFSPTDLMGAALGSCVLTTMAIFAERSGITLDRMSMEVEKEMHAAPRRIARLTLTVHLPAELSQTDRQRLEEAGRGCPVRRSLLPEVDAPVTFIYDE